jgi:hypothetical protein
MREREKRRKTQEQEKERDISCKSFQVTPLSHSFTSHSPFRHPFRLQNFRLALELHT